MNRESKQQIIDDLHDKLMAAKAVFLADFRGMDVGKATALRNELRKATVDYKVIKNTLLDLASRETDKAALSSHYKGPTAVALSYDDPVAAAKVLAKFAKENQNIFRLKAGVLSGKPITVSEIQALARGIVRGRSLLCSLNRSTRLPYYCKVRSLAPRQ